MQNSALLGDIPRLTQGVPKGPVQVEHARRPRCLGDLLDECKTDRRHARRLDFSCQQSHGPRADGSGGDEEHEVNVRVGQSAADRPSGSEQRFRTPAKAESKVLVCNPTDDTLRFELTQALQREDEVDIAQGIRPVVGLMRNSEIGGLRIARNDTKRGVAVQIKGLVLTKMNAARRDDGDRGLGDRSPQRSPGDLAWGEALELRERDQPAQQVTERLPAPAPADPAQDAFIERVYRRARWSVVFVHDSSLLGACSNDQSLDKYVIPEKQVSINADIVPP